MLDSLATIIAALGGSAALIAAAVWLIQALVAHYTRRDLEAYKSVLKFQSDERLKTHEATLKERADIRLAEIDRQAKEQLARQSQALQLQLDQERARLAASSAQDERIRHEIERWANPIRDAVLDLGFRLDNILNKKAHVALSPTAAQPPFTNWSISYDYFMPSTVFLLCQFFCWTRLFRERLTFDLFAANADKDRFIGLLESIGDTLSRSPIEDRPASDEPDMQIFRLQQRAFGESLIEGTPEAPQCMRAAKFLDRWSDPSFRQKFLPLERFLQDLTPGTCRELRLRRMAVALAALDKVCEQILSPAASCRTGSE